MWIGTTTTTKPDCEPLTLEEARAQCSLDPSDTSRDDRLSVCLMGARSRIERSCGIRLIKQSVEMRCTRWADLDRLPLGIIQSVESIGYGTGLTFTGCTLANPGGLWPTLSLSLGQQWPMTDLTTVITVAATAGFGEPEDVPAEIMIAVRLLTSHYFDNPNPVSVGERQVLPIPALLDDILADWKRMVLL